VHQNNADIQVNCSIR